MRLHRALVVAFLLPIAPIAASAQTVDEVVAKYTAARGGAERWKAVQSLEMTGTFTSYSQENPFTLQWKRPGLYRFESDSMTKPFVIGRDAGGVWWIFPLYGIDKAARASEPDSIPLAREAEFEPALLGWREKGHKVELAGPGDIDGQKTLKLAVTLANGWVETWHLDPKTFLEVAVDSRVIDRTQLEADLTQRTYFSDFRVVDGLVIPHQVEKEYGARHTVTAVEKVRVNPPLEDGSFKMP
jgi:hypothetical protein